MLQGIWGGGVLGHVKVKRSRKRAERERERVNSAIIIICHTQSSSIQIMSFFVAVLGISPFSILMPSAPGCSSFLDSSEAGFTAPENRQKKIVREFTCGHREAFLCKCWLFLACAQRIHLKTSKQFPDNTRNRHNLHTRHTTWHL